MIDVTNVTKRALALSFLKGTRKSRTSVNVVRIGEQRGVNICSLLEISAQESGSDDVVLKDLVNGLRKGRKTRHTAVTRAVLEVSSPAAAIASSFGAKTYKEQVEYNNQFNVAKGQQTSP